MNLACVFFECGRERRSTGCRTCKRNLELFYFQSKTSCHLRHYVISQSGLSVWLCRSNSQGEKCSAEVLIVLMSLCSCVHVRQHKQLFFFSPPASVSLGISILPNYGGEELSRVKVTAAEGSSETAFPHDSQWGAERLVLCRSVKCKSFAQYAAVHRSSPHYIADVNIFLTHLC